jgi:hypothetical protein
MEKLDHFNIDNLYCFKKNIFNITRDDEKFAEK